MRVGASEILCRNVMNTVADRVKGHSRLQCDYDNCLMELSTWLLPQPCHERVLDQRDQRALRIRTVSGVRRDDRSVRTDLQGLADLFGVVRLVPVEAVEGDNER